MTAELFDLTGRVAVVTGAAGGIGRASAQLLAASGASVVCADVQGGLAEETAGLITAAGGTATAAEVDVSKRAEVERLVDGAVSTHGRLDVMCNIAGIMHDSTVLETDEADLDRVLAVNFKGVFFGCQAAGRVMVEQGSGSIVNTASTAIDMGAPGIVCYSTAKAAVTQLTKTLATEIGPSGVRVNAVAPGYVVTPMTARRWTNPDGSVDEARRDGLLRMMGGMAPLRRTGVPDDIAAAVLYLASDAASFVTGQILRPNGGATMPW